MDSKITETLSEWTAPRLLRLNQTDGTEKHVLWTESVTAPSPQPTECGGTGQTFGGGVVGNNCGPS